MRFNELKRYLGIFILGFALIIVYKTFDNLGYFFEWISNLWKILMPFIIAFSIAYILYTPCVKIEELCQKLKFKFVIRHRRGIAVVLIYFVFILLVALILLAIIPALIRSIKDFVNQLPTHIYGAVVWFNSLGIYEINQSTIQQFLNNNIISIENILNSIDFASVNKYAKSVLNIGTAVFDGFMGIIISVYILLDRTSLKENSLRFVRSFIPEKRRKVIGEYLSKINHFVHIYIYCQLLDALIVFVLSFIVLSIMKIEYTPLLAFIIGSFNLIPYFGAIVATVIATLITIFTKGFYSALGVVAALIILQQVDSNFIQPKLLSDSLNVKPFWVILGIIVGGGLFCVIGIFLAVPIIALLRIVIIDILEKREHNKALNTIK